jgi:hypothetical protein
VCAADWDRDRRPGGLADDGREIITRIEVTDWKRPRAQAKEVAEAPAELEVA